MKSNSNLFPRFRKGISYILFCTTILFTGCSSNNSTENHSEYADAVKEMDMPDEVKKSYTESVKILDDIEKTLKVYNLTHSNGKFETLYELYNNLHFDYYEDVLSADSKKFCNNHTYKIDSIRFVVKNALENGLPMYQKTIVNEDDKLIDQEENYPFYLPRGTVLYIDGDCSDFANIKLYNTDSEHIIRSWNKKKSIHDSIVINNGAIYVVNVTTKGSQYLTLTLKKNLHSIDDLDKDYEIKTEDVECKAGESRAKKIEAIKISSIFEEPHKITLRSQGKAFFSGGSRSIVAMQVPNGCSDLLYSLRISTSQSDMSSDGQFCKNVNEKYKEIKFLGLPLYESHGTSSNIFRELLNYSEPSREEEAYCNLYVFTKSDQAKKFMDGRAISELKYNVDLSKQGTQSCNDRIPTKGLKTIYFGFENTRVRYSVYLWLESIATVKKTEYVKTKYVLDE